jgi:perosamine synthetase
MFRRPLFSDFSPNMTATNTWTALSFLLPWKLHRIVSGDADKRVESRLAKMFGATHVNTFDSGRTALYYALKAAGVDDGDEVIVQGYTCIVVSNAITWMGAKPVYVDIDETLNIEVDAIEKKISEKTKAIIVQHTFGRPADMNHIMRIAGEYSIPVVEDCAHAFGGTYEGKQLGTVGDIGMFSFGSDKIISSVRGGALVSSHPDFSRRIKMYHNRLPSASILRTIQHLHYYPIFSIAKPLYGIGLGKALFVVARKLHLLAKIIYPEERRGRQVLFFPSRLPNSLATILLQQLSRTDEANQHRHEIFKMYAEQLSQFRFVSVGEGVPLYFAFFYKRPGQLQAALKKKDIYLTLYWTGQTIVPATINPTVAKYKEGQCPVAEDLSKMVVTLPTHRGIRKKDAQRIIDAIILCTK